MDVPGLRSAAQGRLGGDADAGVKALGTVRLEVEVVPDEDAEGSVAGIVVTVTVALDRSRPDLAGRAELVVLAALNPHEQDWDTNWTASGAVYASLLPADNLRAHARDALGRVAGATVLGCHAHYAHKERLTQSAVDGLGVRSMCGTWFVPRQDAEALERCPACTSAYGRLTAEAAE